jgi:hypothetical protein
VLKTVRDDTEGKSLNLCFGFFWTIPICENARQVDHFGDPATVFFLFDFHSKFHSRLFFRVESYRFLVRLKRPLGKAAVAMCVPKLEPVDRENHSE